MTFVDMHVKCSVTLTDPMGPEILTVLRPDQDGFKLFKIFNFIAILCSYNGTVVIMKYSSPFKFEQNSVYSVCHPMVI